MILTAEVTGLIASLVGVLGLVLRKTRCFIRRVGSHWDCGGGFVEPQTEIICKVKPFTSSCEFEPPAAVLPSVPLSGLKLVPEQLLQ